MTAGNLATHLRKLEEAGYVEVTKAYRRRTPVTYLALTRAGRRALEDYTAALRDLLGVPAPNGHASPGPADGEAARPGTGPEAGMREETGSTPRRTGRTGSPRRPEEEDHR